MGYLLLLEEASPQYHPLVAELRGRHSGLVRRACSRFTQERSDCIVNRNPAYSGKVREWFKRQSWKDCVPEMVPRVRIPPFPLCAGERLCIRNSTESSNLSPLRA